MMKRILFLFTLLVFSLSCGHCQKEDGPDDKGGNQEGKTPETVGQQLSAWKEGQLDIHFINTTTGESVFLIFPDGTQMLVDAAGSLAETGQVNSSVTNTGIRERWDPTKESGFRAGKFIAEYIRKCMEWTGNKTLDYVVCTHFHSDHFGGFSNTLPLSDLSGTYRKQSLPEVLDLLPAGKLMDRGWPDYEYPFDMRTKASNYDAVSNYVTAVKWHVAEKGLVAERFKAGSRDQIVMKHKPSEYPGFVVQNIAVNGEIWNGGASTDATATFPPLSEIQVANPKSVGNADNCPEENHCTCVLKVSYGSFDFFEGGDAQYDGMSSFPWKDMETPVALVTGPVDVMKADHHGVTNTNGYGYTSKVTGKTAEALKYLSPTCWVVNSWTDGHPREVTFDGVTALYPAMDIYVTNICDDTRTYGNVSQIKGFNGHIVVRVYKGGAVYKVYTVSDSDRKMTVKKISKEYRSK